MQDSLLARVGEAVWGWPMMALFLGTGIWYMLRLRGLPLRRLGQALRAIFRGGESADGISPYAALCTALAATIGTGNIVGVATALAAGGPGALLWMMVAALFGMATQYAEGYLAVRYRRRQGGKWLGGPFCYIEQGLGWRWLAVTFAVVGAAVGLLGVGTVAQVNSITTAVEGFFDPLKRSVAMTAGGNAVTWAAVIAGGLTVLFSAMVLLGGAERISRVCSLVVPLMSAVYVLCSVLILVRCRAQIPAALRLIAVSAFSPRAAAGAAGGLTMRRILRMGIGRGVFTNEAGLGSTPIAAACSSNEDPVRQGLVTMTGTFLDTIVICSLTGLCLVVTGAWCVPGLAGFAITEQAWRTALPWPAGLSSFLLLACLVFFAFSTIIGWNFYGEQCLRYLTGGSQRAQRLYRWCYLAALCTAPLLSVKAAWELADILNACMALPNLTALLLLWRQVVEGSRRPAGKT